MLSPQGSRRRFLGWYLQGCGSSSDQEAQGLRHQRDHGAQCSKQDKPHSVGRLRRHPVHDAAVGHREHDLGTQGPSASRGNHDLPPRSTWCEDNACPLSTHALPRHTWKGTSARVLAR